MQPLIERYPRTKFVILHASYPYTRDAGYLAAVYKNVFLDFGEVRNYFLEEESLIQANISCRYSPLFPVQDNVMSFGRCLSSRRQIKFCGRVS